MGRRLANTAQKYPQPINPEGEKVIKLKFKPQAKTFAQSQYLESLREQPLTIGVGPAGTGKSFLAMAVALEKLLSKEVSKIVITRPVCEAGESLGFLPGTFEEKIAPYLKPLLDAMEDLIGPTMTKKMLDGGLVEFAPLAYMRGRTFNNSFVILDEAQNTTVEQIKLFVTRIGEYSQFVINGDSSQSDLIRVQENGLDYIVRRLAGKSNKINVVQFMTSDVQRSEIVKTILLHLDGPDERVVRRAA
jgi:phosphate starvation-inducible PhoH-like protein